MFSGIYNIGIGGGALIGSQVIIHSGLTQIGYSGATLGMMALAWGLVFCLYFMRRAQMPSSVNESTAVGIQGAE